MSPCCAWFLSGLGPTHATTHDEGFTQVGYGPAAGFVKLLNRASWTQQRLHTELPLLGLILLLLASHGLTEANKQLMNQFSNKRGSNNKHIKEKAAANKRQGESSSGSIIRGLASDEGTVPARSRRPSTLAWARVLL